MLKTIFAGYNDATRVFIKRPIRIHRWIKSFLFLNFLILIVHSPCGYAADGHGPPQTELGTKKVLILHSHEANAPVFIGTDKGFLTALEAGGIPRLNMIFESLELRRYPLAEYRRNLIEQMRLRYSQQTFDMIITMYPEALEFVLKECADIFPDIPVLALYLPEGYVIKNTGRRIIGHSALLDITGTLQAAMKLLPTAKRVYVVSGAHAVDRMIEQRARAELRNWEAHLEFEYLSSLPFDEILSTIAKAPKDAIILQLIFSQDISGNSYTAPNLTQRLSQAAGAPIFGLLDVALGYGIVGGRLINFENIGIKAGELVLDILSGHPADLNLSDTLEVPSKPMFDWRQLRRWNLRLSDLPEGSIIINRRHTLWDFKYYILAALTFIIAQSCLILTLFVQKRRLHAAQESLRQKTEELNRFFNVTLDLLCIANTEGYFLRLNPVWEKVLGYSRKELMTRRFFEFLHPDDLVKTQDAVSRLASQMELIQFGNRYLCKDGSYRYLEWTAVPSGKLIYASARDVTERLEIEAEGHQRREELAHLSRIATLGELTASLAHEINQPLSAIMSNAQAATRYLNAPRPNLEEIREILRDIVQEDARAGEVINRVRGLLKKNTPVLEALDVNQILRDVVGFLRSDAVIRDVRVSLTLDSLLPQVKGDRIQLQQVVLNLLVNAFDAMNGRPIGDRRVLIRSSLNDSQVLISVADSGKGIPNGEEEKVFNSYHTSKPHGLGMGLSISRSIIKRHQGRIWVENNSEGGATFIFTLPIS